MLEEVDRLTNLVDTLLRLSHGDAGTVRLSREAIDLGQLTRDVVSSLGILAEERNQRLTLEVAEGVSVTADRLVLREAITNVVDNAIKYSPWGSRVDIRVHANATRRFSPLPTKDRGSPLSTASGSSIASFASMKPGRGIVAAPASGWPSPNGRSR